jgi:hypothetical protein
MDRIKTPKLNLKPTLSHIGKELVKDMRKRILGRRGLSNQPVHPNRPSTIKKKGFDHRMVDTGAFVKRAHYYRAKAMSVVISLYKKPHPSSNGRATYYDVGKYNQKGHPDANKNADLHQHFVVDIAMADWAITKIKDEAFRQIDKKLTFKITVNA